MSEPDKDPKLFGRSPHHVGTEPAVQILNSHQQAFPEVVPGGGLTKAEHHQAMGPRRNSRAEHDGGANKPAPSQTFSASAGSHLGPEFSRTDQPYSSGSNYTTPGFDNDVLDEDFGLMLNLGDYDEITTGGEFPSWPNSGSSQSILMTTHASRVPNISSTGNGMSPELQNLKVDQASICGPSITVQLPTNEIIPDADHSSGHHRQVAFDHGGHDLFQEIVGSKVAPNINESVDLQHPSDSEQIAAIDSDLGRSIPTQRMIAKARLEEIHKSSTVFKQSSVHGGAGIIRAGFRDDAELQNDISSGLGILRSKEDGSWRGSANGGPTGVGPEARSSLNDNMMPSLRDQEKQRLLSTRKIEVERWLVQSETESETSQVGEHFLHAVQQLDKYNDDIRTELTINNRWGRTNDAIAASSNHADEEDHSEDNQDENNNDYNASDMDTGTLPVPYAGGIVDGSNSEQNPEAQEPHNRRPWVDSPLDQISADTKGQPPSSNAAIRRFMERARDIETASFTATIGSRRRSEADLNSLFSAPAISVRVPTIREESGKENGARRPSLFARVMPKRSTSNVKKRKSDQPNQEPPPAQLTQARKESQGSLSATRRMGDWVRPKSPKVDTSIAPVRSVTSPASSTTLTRPFSFTIAKDGIRRSRSRSDLGRTPGIAERWALQGGPPVPTLKPPSQDVEVLEQYDHVYTPRLTGYNSEDDADGEEDGSPGAGGSTILNDQRKPLAPTHDGFKAHIQQLYPQLAPFLVERIAQEQLRRYNRLVASKITHIQSSNGGHCVSGNLCGALDRGWPSNSSNQNKAVGPITFHITASDLGEVTVPPSWESATTTTFSNGMPHRPLHQLPAEFECSRCFQVKRMSKPSDWTKHMHEDLQPFACTFPNCGEPKSFKRKADWVRHENECHRHLESWVCNFPDCTHVCYRKDNYVQHLVREHKQPEPRVRANSTANDDQGTMAHLVNSCRHDTTKKPSDEPCRFCGTLCSTWKKLTVHLAKHMEHISMPILTLVDQTEWDPSMIRSSIDEDISLTHAHRSVYTIATPATEKEKVKKPRSSVASSPGNDVVKTERNSGVVPIFVQNRVPEEFITSNTQSYPGLHNPPLPTVMPSQDQTQQYWTPQVTPSYGYGAVTSPGYPDVSRQSLYPEQYGTMTEQIQPLQAMYNPSLYTPTSIQHHSFPPSPQVGAHVQGPPFASSPIANIPYGQFSASPPTDTNSSSILWDPQQPTYQEPVFTTYGDYALQNVSNNPLTGQSTTYPQYGNRDQMLYAQHIQGLRNAQVQHPIQYQVHPDPRGRSHGREAQ